MGWRVLVSPQVIYGQAFHPSLQILCKHVILESAVLGGFLTHNRHYCGECTVYNHDHLGAAFHWLTELIPCCSFQASNSVQHITLVLDRHSQCSVWAPFHNVFYLFWCALTLCFCAHRLNSTVECIPYNLQLSSENALQLIQQYPLTP